MVSEDEKIEDQPYEAPALFTDVKQESPEETYEAPSLGIVEEAVDSQLEVEAEPY